MSIESLSASDSTVGLFMRMDLFAPVSKADPFLNPASAVYYPSPAAMAEAVVTAEILLLALRVFICDLLASALLAPGLNVLDAWNFVIENRALSIFMVDLLLSIVEDYCMKEGLSAKKSAMSTYPAFYALSFSNCFDFFSKLATLL